MSSMNCHNAGPPYMMKEHTLKLAGRDLSAGSAANTHASARIALEAWNSDKAARLLRNRARGLEHVWRCKQLEGPEEGPIRRTP
jgi:hypothetical protein